MKLSPGNRLGPYRIVEPAGVGGMGEVYKAEDTRLERTVAIKILPSSVAVTESQRTRFEREAKAIAGLSNPNICTLYDVGHDEGTDYLIMEYLEGQTLAEKLKSGPLDAREALEIGIRVAEALESAHRRGIVHRDLKPANIMLTSDGPKVLDFGLSKAVAADSTIEGLAGPTETTPLTDENTIVGTMQYMSPEQLESGAITPRTDIFAFGAVMYEMLTGHRAFKGKGRTSLIASILRDDPSPVSEVQALSPVLDRVVRKCLEKDPDARWQSARDLADELRWLLDSRLRPATEEMEQKHRVRLLWPVVTGASVVIAVLLIALFLFSDNGQEDSRVRRFVIPIANDDSPQWPRLSPDGRFVAYQARDSVGEVRQIYIRPLDSLQAYPLPGTEGSMRPFWSPDSRSVAFFQHGLLKRISISGGPPQTICKYPDGADGCWSKDDIILFDKAGSNSDLVQVPASGGTPSPAMSVPLRSDGRSWPWFLPDGQHFMYLVDDDLATPTDNLLLKAGSLDSDFDRTFMRVDSRVEYTDPGYLVYVKDGVLLAHPFDAEKLSFSGNPIAIDQDVSIWDWGANFSLASDGTLVYQKGSGFDDQGYLLWIDRSGKILDTISPPGFYRDIALSPDDNLLAVSELDKDRDTRDIWVIDLDRQIESRITHSDARDFYPAWSQDGKYVYFSSDRNNRCQVFRKRANGFGAAELIYSNPDNYDVTGFGSWANRDNLVYIFKGATPWSFGLLDLDGSQDSAQFVETKFNQWSFGASPDGRYLLYTSDEGGIWQVYVRHLGTSGDKWQISADGGHDAVWSADGSEIFYMENDGKTIVAVPVDWQEGFKAGRPDRLFTKDIQPVFYKRLVYAPSSDGQKFVVNVALQHNLKSDFVIVLNWQQDYPAD